MKQYVIDRILEEKIIAIVRGLTSAPLFVLMDAFLAGGISLVELAFDQKDPSTWKETCECIRSISEHYQDGLLIGAGTVLTVDQVKMAQDAGARYIVSPDANLRVIRYTCENDMVSIPGCMTSTEITSAMAAGADFIKLFPAGVLGTDYIKALRAPLGHAKMLAVGGINERNIKDFMRAGCVGVGVGGNLINKDWIMHGEFKRIKTLAESYAAAARSDER